MDRSRFGRTGLTGVACLAVLGAGCGGSNGGAARTNPPANAVVAGLWTGVDLVSGHALTAIIDAAGNLVAVRSDGLEFVGSLQVAGDTVAATLGGYANFGRSFPDTSDIYGIGTLSGTAATDESITATVGFTTDATLTSVPGSWMLTPSAASGVPASLSAVTGAFAVASPGVSAAPPVDRLTISATGVMSGEGTTTGCQLQGTVGTPDPSINEYAVTYTVTGCTANYAVLNGVTFTGLGFADYTTSPATITLAVHGSTTTSPTNGIDFGIISTLTAT